jgi:hypothetical protein
MGNELNLTDVGDRPVLEELTTPFDTAGIPLGVRLHLGGDTPGSTLCGLSASDFEISGIPWRDALPDSRCQRCVKIHETE